MVLLKKIKQNRYNAVIKNCRNSDAKKLIKTCENDAVTAFNHALKHSNIYRNCLNKTIDINNLKDIKSIQDFKTNIPLINKNLVYDNIDTILENLTAENMRSLLLSSGTTGTFSFSVNSQKEIKKSTKFLELILDHYYGILTKKTLLINCLTVKLPSFLDGTLAEIGPRSDTLAYLIENMSPYYDQTIIIGDNYFIKNSIEDGIAKGIDFSDLKIHLILGGVYLPETLREYLSSLLKIDPANTETGSILSSMGISEFGFNLFFESTETIRLRKIIQKDDSLRKQLLGDEIPYLPMCFNYFPQAFYIEEINDEIVITTLSKAAKIPLIRYNTQDCGRIINFETLNRVLAKNGLNSEKLLPRFKSPLVLMFGKIEYLKVKNTKIYPPQIQDIIYSNPNIANKTTGYFHLTKAQESKKPRLVIQMKKYLISKSDKQNYQKLCEESFYNYFTNQLTKKDIDIIIEPYNSFHWGLEIDYERKFKYI
ncbi:MAG: phenylacetate-CoA ligase [Lysobacterales bacterium]|jgi:phenylacetate-CoA ligase